MKDRIKRFIATTLAYFGIKPAQQPSADFPPPPLTRPVVQTGPHATFAAQSSKLWNPPAADSRETLALTVRTAASGIRAQMSSQFVSDGSQPELYAQLDRISAGLLQIPPRRFFPETPNATETDIAIRVERANLRALPPVPTVGESRTEVANALFGFASCLKTQVQASAVLNEPGMQKLKDQLSDTADRLSGISGDVCVAFSSKRSHSR